MENKLLLVLKNRSTFLLKSNLTIFLVLFLIHPFASWAQIPDLTFRPSIYSEYEMDGQIRASILQPTDNKLVIAGDFSVIDNSSRKSLARLNADGSLDPSFNPGASVNEAVYALAIQPDGKILIGGLFNSYDGRPQNKLARLHPNGTLDTTFHNGKAPSDNFSIGTGGNNYINAIEIQPDGKIVVGGYFTTNDGSFYLSKIARLHPDGTIDKSFNPGNGVNNTVNTVAVQPDGKIIIGGSFTAVNNISRIRIARLNPDGSLDPDFNAGMEVSSDATTQLDKVLLQPDGKILIAGDFVSVKGSPQRYFARLNADGSLDPDFNAGSGADGVVNYLLLQPDGKIVLAGDFTSINDIPNQHIARLNPDGILDASFVPGEGADGKVVTLALFPNGNIVAAGSFTSYNDTECQNLVQILPTGKLNTQYNINKGSRSKVKSIVLQPNGKVLIGGGFSTVGGFSRNYIARVNINGSIDKGFNPGTGANDYINVLALQADGKVIAGGNFTTINDVPRNYIARLNANGTLDKSFEASTNAQVEAIVIQPDGRIIISGNFTRVNDQAKAKIARLNTDGSLDASFLPPTGINNTVSALLIDADGKILIGGAFTRLNNITRKYFARLNPNGGLDANFYPGTGPDGSVETIIQQLDGKIIFAGAFTTVNGESRKSIARLNTDGTLDSGFKTGTGFNNTIYTLALRTDGRIVVGGIFTGVDGKIRNRIARLHPNGSLDNNFNPKTKGKAGANREVNTLAILPDNRLLLGGYFTMVNDKSLTRIAMLSAKAPQSITFPIIENVAEGSAPITITATASSGLPVTVVVVSGPAKLEGNQLIITGSGEVKITATQAGNEDYAAATPVERTFCVLPAKPVITVNGNILTSSSDTGNQWYLNGTAIENATAKTFTATVAGEYTVAVLAGTCGSSASDGQKITEELLKELNPVKVLSVYPNPATAILKIEGSDIGAGPISLLLYDAAGRKVWKEEFTNTSKNLKMEVQISHWPRGYFIMHLVTSKGVLRQALVLH